MAEYIGKRIIPRHAGAWDKTKTYEPLEIVLADNGDSYTSRCDVPAGTALTDTDYWALSARFDAQLKETYDNMTDDMRDTLTEMNEDFTNTHTAISKELADTKDTISKDLTDTHTAITNELSETHTAMSEELQTTETDLKEHVSTTETNLTAKVDAATAAMNSTRTLMNNNVTTLKSRMDAIASATTEAGTDFEAEVVDMRVDSGGTTYASAGTAVRSITDGLPEKLLISDVASIHLNSNSGCTVEKKGRVVKCGFTRANDGGYVGFFFSMFGKKSNYTGKKYRIVIKGDPDVETAFTMLALVTNANRAWGSADGSVMTCGLPTVNLNAKNGYTMSIDVDFTSEKLQAYLAKLTKDSALYFCMRNEEKKAFTASFYVYVFELDVAPGLFWKYSSGYDDINAVKSEVEAARNDGTAHSTLGALTAAHKTAIDKNATELTDSHTDSRGTSFKSIKQRLDSLDAVVIPRLAISANNQPRDNVVGVLKDKCPNIYGEKVNNNFVAYFDYAQYTALANAQWSSLNFYFCVDKSTVKSITDLSEIYLEIQVEGVDDATKCVGKTFSLGYYVNKQTNWAATVNGISYATVTIGKKNLIHIPQAQIDKVIAANASLFIVFQGYSLKNSALNELSHYKITASLLNYSTSGGTGLYSGYSDYAVKAEKADVADTAENADTAAWADNYFVTTPAELLNTEGVRYSPGMDTTDIPETCPYTMNWSSQGLIKNGMTAKRVANGFSPYVQFDMTLSKNAGQTYNQGGVKLLSGMLSFKDMAAKFNEGYKSFYVCQVDDCVSYPEGATSGNYPQVLLIAYTTSSAANNKLFSIYSPTRVKLSDDRIMRIWECKMTDELLAALNTAMTDSKFGVYWFGVWNTAKYTGDTDIPWTVKWYWQDYAFTDGSYTADEMVNFFRDKYRYRASMVNHPVLVKKFAGLDDDISALNTGLDEVKTGFDETIADVNSAVEKANTTADEAKAVMDETKTEVETELELKQEIVCWGDSLTAGAGWTGTLQKLSGLTVYNAGTGGESARTIVARQGADVMTINNITIPADCTPVTIATRADDKGIKTEWGYTVTPLLQGGGGHVNPVKIGDIEGTLKWTGSSHSDGTGTWTFTRTAAGDAVAIKRPTAIRTAYDRNHNKKNTIMIIFIGQNGGYSDVDDLIRQHKMMIDHSRGKQYVVLGLSSGTAEARKEYEIAMKKAFGRRFISLREYLATPIYDTDGETVISCYGLDDAGLDATDADIERIKNGQVPQTLLSDSVHYTTATKTVIGTMLYKKMCELGIF